MKKLSRKLKIVKEGGFTLVEILFVVLFLGLIFGLILMTVVNSSNTTKQILDSTTSEIDSRTSMYVISKDLREATNILSATEEAIRFKGNLDNDSEAETVDIYLQSNEGYYKLYKSIDSQDPVLLSDFVINNAIFEYYSDINNLISLPISSENLKNIKIIKISLEVDQSGSSTLKTMSLSTSVTLRNRV